MLHFTRSKFTRVVEMPLTSLVAHGITGGGQALMAVTENGIGKVKIHDGTAAPVVGFSVTKASPETNVTTSKSFFPTAAALTDVLPHTPVGTVTAFNKTTNSAVVVDTTAGSGQIGVVGTAVTFHSSMAGHEIVVIYNFSPTIAQLRMIQGDQEPGGNVSLALNSIGVAKQGTIYTSCFDPAAAWATFNQTTHTIASAANGKLTIVAIANANIPGNPQLVQAPLGDVPFVGFHFSV